VKYRIYIDEVGNPDLERSDDPNHRFLSLTGVILELDYVRSTVHPQVEGLKRKYFPWHPDDPIPLHRKEIMNARPPFDALKDPAIRRKFDHDLLDCLASWDYTVITVCLDKKKHKETYAVWRYDPYHYCLMVLLERFVFFLRDMDAVGDALAESRGGKEDRRLKDSFARLWVHGTDYVAPERFQDMLTSKELKVKPKSNNISGLQLADLVAHPSRNEILREQGLLGKELAPFAARVVQTLQHNYYQRGRRVFGKKFL
jgi:hypothetical protein